ncbi:MAG: argininosuccinate lyase [Chloroflexi bacterium]|nr:MAG: argininosuccinate lyase [Chloroflexota bacterium]
MTLWGGRFSTKLNQKAWMLNSSLPFDQRLAVQDVTGSIAWAGALLEASVFNEDEHAAIQCGLNTIAAEFESSSFIFVDSDEDIHTAVERRLGELIGIVAGKLHTGRSRNDQVVTDFRLWILEMLPQLDEVIKGLQSILVNVTVNASLTCATGSPSCPWAAVHWQEPLSPSTAKPWLWRSDLIFPPKTVWMLSLIGILLPNIYSALR